MKHNRTIIMALVLALVFCGCIKQDHQPINATIIKVCPSDPGSHFYVLREVHTVIDTNQGRMIVPGDLGAPGEAIILKAIPIQSLFE